MLELAFYQIQQQHPVSAELLICCCFLAPDAIAEQMLQEGACHLGPVLAASLANPLQFRSTIKTLLMYSLIHRDQQEGVISLHRLQQTILKARLSEAENKLMKRNPSFFKHWHYEKSYFSLAIRLLLKFNMGLLFYTPIKKSFNRPKIFF